MAIANLWVAPREGSARVGEVANVSAALVISPRLFSSICPPRGIFPLRFRGQPVIFSILLPEPFTVPHRLEARTYTTG